MAQRYEEEYRLRAREAATASLLSERLNAVFQSVDLRISGIEERASNIRELEEALNAYGVDRVNAVLAPVLAAIRASADLGGILTTTSITLETIGPGLREFVIPPALRDAFAPTAHLSIVADAAPASAMFARRVAWDRASGLLTVDVVDFDGAGQFEAWTISAAAVAATAGFVRTSPAGALDGMTLAAQLEQIAALLALTAAIDHAHTKDQVGLGNVDNTSDANKPISAAVAAALAAKSSQGHGHSKADVGLANVNNTSDNEKPLSNAAVAALAGKSNTGHGHTKAEVGLGNVDNTSDANKPVSTATQTALNGKSNTGHGHTVADVTGLAHTATAGAIPRYSDAAGSQAPAAALFESAAGMVGIGTQTPEVLLDVRGLANFGSSSGGALINIDSSTALAAAIAFRRGGTLRWAMQVNGNETGANAGASMAFRAYDDAGVLLSAPVSIVRATGHVGLGTGTPTARLDNIGDTYRQRVSRTPASATAAGNAGDICWDSGFIYVCVATNSWKRVAINTW